MPEVSIIMGVCNGGRFLGLTLASLREQTWRDWELVLVDNGSSDGAVEAELQAHPDPRVRVSRHPEALSPGGALDVACQTAGGRFLAVLDMDDLAHPRRLEIQRDYLVGQPDICLLGTGSDLIDEDGRWLGREPHVGRHEDIHALTAYVHALRHSSVMFRRELLDRVRYRAVFGRGSDHDFFARAAETGRVEALPAPLCLYRLHPANHSKPSAAGVASRGLIQMVTHRRRRGLPEELEKWVRVFHAAVEPARGDAAVAHLAIARVFAREGLDDLVAFHAWEAMRAGARWRGLGRYLGAVAGGLGRQPATAAAIARAWLKEPAHQLLRNGGTPDRPQF